MHFENDSKLSPVRLYTLWLKVARVESSNLSENKCGVKIETFRPSKCMGISIFLIFSSNNVEI